MEKRSYVKPVLSGEEFIPQNYCAVCGDSGTIYKFNCNSGGGNLYYYPNGKGDAIYENGIQKGWNGAKSLGSVSNCNTKHETDADEFPLGFIDSNSNGYEDEGEAVRVYLETWKGPITGNEYVYNYHATRDLDMNTWETLKS